MDVDYRAVAQRAVLAAWDAQHVWVATDTGMILGRVDGKTSASRRERTNKLGALLFYPHLLHSRNFVND